MIRNYLVAGEYVFLDTRTGYNLYIGFNKYADGCFNLKSARQFQTDLYNHLNIKKPSGNEYYIPFGIEGNKFGIAYAKNFILKNPLKSISLIPKKFLYFWDFEKRDIFTAYSRNYIGKLDNISLFLLLLILMVPFALVTLFAVLGVVYSDFNRGVWLFVLLTIYYVGISSLLLGDAQLHMVLVPFLIVFASDGILKTPQIMRQLYSADPVLRKKTLKRGAISISLILMFIYVWSYGIYLDWTKFQTIFGPLGNTSVLPY